MTKNRKGKHYKTMIFQVLNYFTNVMFYDFWDQVLSGIFIDLAYFSITVA